MHYHLLPECYADTFLVNRLINAESNHQRGINAVFATLKSRAAKKQKGLGLIDDDKLKEKLAYYKEYTLIHDYPCFRYMGHPSGIHFLIVTKGGGFEAFIKLCAEESGVEHRLLSDFRRLRILAKSPTVHQNKDFKDLVNTLIQKKSPTLMEIKRLLLSL
ncbi:MAG: hypothetical protein JSS76_14005 [Bacteroidetes bacterium]|nr:hypothetical protein [Bacteroidota bacterium]